MFLQQPKPKDNQNNSRQNKNETSRENLIQEPVFPYWLKHGHEILGPNSDYSNPATTPVQKKETAEEKEGHQTKQMKPEGPTINNVDAMKPTIVYSEKQQKTAQRKKLEDDIRQNKPKGMNSNTYLKLSDKDESSKMMAKAKFAQYKKDQVKQLKRDKQAKIQFNSRVNNFENALIQRKIAYGSEEYNNMLGEHFPDFATQQQVPQTAAPVQKKDNTPNTGNSGEQVRQAENKTGLPDNLKSGIEHLSGMDISDVRVHYNSSQPAQMKAHAFAQGNQIHVAPGQEQHLPHEAWHVVQQKQGRVNATEQLKGDAINDDAGLEREADIMEEKAAEGRTAQVNGKSGDIIQKSGDDDEVDYYRLRLISDAPFFMWKPELFFERVKGTNEFKALRDTSLGWQSRYDISEDEALCTCIFIIEDQSINNIEVPWKYEVVEKYIFRAKELNEVGGSAIEANDEFLGNNNVTEGINNEITSSLGDIEGAMDILNSEVEDIEYNDMMLSTAKWTGLIVLGLLADDVTIVGFTDDVLIPFVLLTGLVSVGTIALVNTVSSIIKNFSEEGAIASPGEYPQVDESRKIETDLLPQALGQDLIKIGKKNLNGNGYVYSLRAKDSGKYPIEGDNGGLIDLNKDDVWKYGESTKENRYTQKFLESTGQGLIKVIEFRGTRFQIKAMEKIKLYSYYLLHNGNLPPGNRIFR